MTQSKVHYRNYFLEPIRSPFGDFRSLVFVVVVLYCFLFLCCFVVFHEKRPSISASNTEHKIGTGVELKCN